MEAGARSRRRAAGLRVRVPAVSPRLFRTLCAVALAALVFVTITGATVRLTGSGLGCEDWPRCGETFLPPKSFNSLVEFSNRGVGIAVGIATVIAALAAFLVPGLPRWLLWSTVALPFSVAAQGVLGGITVLTELHPLIVMGHFLLSFAAIALAIAVLLGAHWFATAAAPRDAPRWLAWLAVGLVPLLLALVVSGAFVTAAGPHSGGEGIPRFGDLETAVYVHVRANAAFGIGFLVLLVALWRNRETLGRELALAAGVLAVLVAQMVVGEVQWRNHLTPWWLVLIHVTLATAVFSGMTLAAIRLVRRTRPSVD